MRSLTGTVLVLLLVPGVAGAASFTPLGTLIGAGGESWATAVSTDGSVVVGTSAVAAYGSEAFRWTEPGGMVGLGNLPGSLPGSTANSVSADGSVVVGDSNFAGTLGSQPFRWTVATGMLPIVDPPVQGGGRAEAVSADGLAVVVSLANGSALDVFRWTSTEGFIGLGHLPGGGWGTFPYDISADGSVIVGTEFSETLQGLEAFRWTNAGGMVGLGDLPGGPNKSVATAVSADGLVVVGSSAVASGEQVFRWTSSGGMVPVGETPVDGEIFIASGVSADGAVIVGFLYPVSGNQVAIIWTDGGSAQRLGDLLAENGARGLSGWSLRVATGISADGKWVVGSGINPDGFHEAFRANITASKSSGGGGGALDGASLLALWLVGWQRRGRYRRLRPDSEKCLIFFPEPGKSKQNCAKPSKSNRHSATLIA